MEINVRDYLSDSDISEACRDAVRIETLKILKTEKDLERVITNHCYAMVSKMADEQMGGDLIKVMAGKVKGIVNKLSHYTVFKQPDAWNREPNNAYTHLQQCIEKQFPRIQKVVEDNVDQQTIDCLADDLNEHIIEAVQGMFTKKA